jgi:hypothetical protein
MFLIDLSNLSLLLGSVPESLALLIFGVCLTGITVAARRFLRRYDENASGKADGER